LKSLFELDIVGKLIVGNFIAVEYETNDALVEARKRAVRTLKVPQRLVRVYWEDYIAFRALYNGQYVYVHVDGFLR
jgi:hypothetical protein